MFALCSCTSIHVFIPIYLGDSRTLCLRPLSVWDQSALLHTRWPAQLCRPYSLYHVAALCQHCTVFHTTHALTCAFETTRCRFVHSILPSIYVSVLPYQVILSGNPWLYLGVSHYYTCIYTLAVQMHPHPWGSLLGDTRGAPYSLFLRVGHLILYFFTLCHGYLLCLFTILSCHRISICVILMLHCISHWQVYFYVPSICLYRYLI